MRRWLTVLVLVCSATSAAWANSITIGQLEYLGTNAQEVSAFKVIVDPTGVTGTQLNLTNLTLSVKGISQSTGAITTPTTLLFVGGPGQVLPSCPCQMATLNIFLSNNNQPVTLRLANGELFTVPALTSVILKSFNGRALEPGASVAISLTAVPEPGTLALVGSGLSLAFFRAHPRKKSSAF
jgi:hypothetical protein